MKKNVKKITVGGLLIALALVLPMAFHLTGSSIFAYAHTCITRRICFRTCVWIFCRIVFTDYKLCFDGYAGSRQIAVYDD